MNKSKRPVNASLAKKIRKEVHRAQTTQLQSTTNSEADELTKKELLKKFPKKTKAQPLTTLSTIKQQTNAKKPKKILSKRTQTGTPLVPTTPAHPHKEGARWITTLKKQTRIQRKSLQKKLSKKAPK